MTAEHPPRNFGLTTRRLPADAAGLDAAARMLSAGGLVAFPTETVYGLGADATDARAVAGIYAAKGRPSFNPLISHVPGLADAVPHGIFDARAQKLAAAFWPGPLTLVVPKTADCRVCDLALAGLDTVALRVPAHPVALELLARVGRPVAAPSANRSGHVSPTLASHVLDDLDGRIDAVVDGGPTHVGVESTVIACLGASAALLRPGGLERAKIEVVLGERLAAAIEDEDAPQSPGMLASHYAPAARVRLGADEIRPGEAALLFGEGRPRGIEQASAIYNLSEQGDLVEAAGRLFSGLRELDRVGASFLAVVPIPAEGLGEAINDRLRRAAAPR